MGVSQNLTVTQKSKDIAGNFSNVRIKLTSTQTGSSHNGYRQTGYYYVSINGGTEKKYTFKYTLPYNTTATILDTSIVVSHRTDGTATIKVRTWIDTDISAGVIQKTQTVVLESIPRSTTPTFSATSAEMGSNVTIKLNRASSSFTHTLSYSFGKASGTIGTGLEASKEWVIPSELANQIPNATSGTCVITCKTYNGSALVGTKTANLILKVPTSVVPAIKSVTFAEATERLKEHFTVFVQNNSTLNVAVDAAGVMGSSITKIETKIQDVVYNGNSFVTALLTESGDLEVITTATDSRGRTATVTKILTVEDYEFPTIHSMIVKRVNTSGKIAEDGERISVYMHYSTSNIINNAGNAENPRTYKLQYKKTNDTDFTTFASGAAALIHAESKFFKAAPIISSDYSYTIRLEITDYFKTVVCDVELPTAYTLMDFNSSGKGVAFGKVSEKNAMEINLPTKLLKGVEMYPDENGQVAEFYKNDRTVLASLNTVENGLELCINKPDGTVLKIAVDDSGKITLPAIRSEFIAEDDVSISRATVEGQGNIITIYAYLTCSTSINKGATKQVGSIPAEIAPKKPIATIGIQGSTGVCSAWIRSDGTVLIRPHTAAVENTTFEFMIVYNKDGAWNEEQEG